MRPAPAGLRFTWNRNSARTRLGAAPVCDAWLDVHFGVRFLRDVCQERQEMRDVALRTLERLLPRAAEVFAPPEAESLGRIRVRRFIVEVALDQALRAQPLLRAPHAVLV
jgi:hypothetical protein